MAEETREIRLRLEGVSSVTRGRPLLRGVDLALPTGEVWVVFGPEGSGASELLRLAVGVSHPTSGRVSVLGIDISRASRRELSRIRRRVGFVFRGTGLISNLSLVQNIELPLRYHSRLRRRKIRQRVGELVETFALTPVRDARPAAVDLLTCRRASFARALALDPDLLLYDYPVEGLDPIMSARLVEFMAQAAGPDRACLVATCDTQYYLGMADHCLMMDQGRLIWRGTPEELARTEDPAVRQLVDRRAQGPIASF